MSSSSTANRSSGALITLLSFAAIYLFWGSSYLADKISIETIPPAVQLATRFLLAGGILYVWLRLRGMPAPAPHYWAPTGLVGALLLVGGQGCIVWSLRFIPSGLAGLLAAIYPIWVVLIEWAGPRRVRPGQKTVIGLALGTIGAALLAGNPTGGGSANLWGVLLMVGASLSWAIGSEVAKTARLPDSPLLSTAMQMLAGGALLLVIGLAFGEWKTLNVEAVSQRSLLALVYLTLFCGTLAYAAYSHLLRVTSSAMVATFAYVNPAVAVFLGWAFANEPVTAKTWFCAALIAVSIYFLTQTEKQKV